MGVSVSMAAMIIFVGAIAFVASTANLATNFIQLLTELTLSINNRYNRAYTRIEITNATISNYTVTLLIKNLGPETIFLFDQGYKWCSLAISYNSAVGWVTYLLDDYNVTDITILNLNATYESHKRNFINPGEGGWITAKLPEGAPKITYGSPIVLSFSTRFGETSKLVVVKDD